MIGLTKRQMDIIALVAKGMTQPEAAHELGVSVQQVKNQLLDARRRASAASTAQLVALITSRETGLNDEVIDITRRDWYSVLNRLQALEGRRIA